MKKFLDAIPIIFFYLCIISFIYQTIRGCQDMFSQDQYCYTKGQRLNRIKIKCSELNINNQNTR